MSDSDKKSPSHAELTGNKPKPNHAQDPLWENELEGSTGLRSLMQQLFIWDSEYFRTVFYADKTHSRVLVCRWLTHSGDGYYYPLIPVLMFWFGYPGAASFVWTGLFAFSLELPLYRFIKNGVRRHRPYDSLAGIERRVQPPDQFSFPSGHTAAAFIIATLMSYHFPLFSPLLLGWAGAVGYSRVYLGVHYPSDVLAGAALGILSSAAALLWLA